MDGWMREGAILTFDLVTALVVAVVDLDAEALDIRVALDADHAVGELGRVAVAAALIVGGLAQVGRRVRRLSHLKLLNDVLGGGGVAACSACR